VCLRKQRSHMGCAVTRGRRGSTATAAGRLHCRLCESGRLISVLDLGATPLSEKLLLPTLHHATSLASNDIGMVRS
jgi:hypothetical protein